MKTRIDQTISQCGKIIRVLDIPLKVMWNYYWNTRTCFAKRIGGQYMNNDILGGGSFKIDDDLLIYAGCKCSYEVSGTPVNPNSLLKDEKAA